MKNYRPTLTLNKDDNPRNNRANSKWYVWLVVGLVAVFGLYLLYSLFKSTGADVVSVHFSTMPTNAQVILDNEYIGNTPFTIDLMDGRDYNLKLECEGYTPIEELISISKSSSSFSRVFERANIQIPITSNPTNAKIYMNNEYLGETPINLNMDQSGVVILKAEKMGYITIELVHDFDSKDPIFIKLEKQQFRVQIDSNPTDAELFINNKHLGKTPVSTRLTYGTHRIRLAKDGFDIVEKTIDVQGDLIDLKYSLDKQGLFIDGITGDVSVPGANVYLYALVDSMTSTKKNQLLMPTSTPISIDQDTILTYLTLDEDNIQKALFVGKRDGISASIEVLEFDSSSGIKSSEILLSFPEISQKEVFGQTIERIDWISLFAEESNDCGDINNNPRYFVTPDGMLIDRDNPQNAYMVGSVYDKVIISDNDEYLASINGTKITFFDNRTRRTIGEVVGTDVIFAESGMAIVKNGNEISITGLPTMQTQIVDGISKPVRIYSIGANLLIIESVGNKYDLYDLTTNSIVDWDVLLGGYSWVDGWVQSGVMSRNIAGRDMIILIGKIYGLKSLLHVENGQVSLMNVWIEGQSMKEVDIPRH